MNSTTLVSPTELRLNLTVAINYGGRDELTRTMRSLAAEVAAGTLDPSAINDALISSRLDTADLPDPDLVIRTSGEQRLSGFLLWQSAYSEMWFTEAHWPDFRRVDFLRALRDYSRRHRRYGV